MRLFWVALLVLLGLVQAQAQGETTLDVGPIAGAPDPILAAPAGRLAQAMDEPADEAAPVIQMTGAASPPVAPIVVEVGLRIHQITSIDQKAENFGIVADLQLEYRDPKLAFSAAECGCTIRLLRADEVVALAKQQGTTWPEIYYFNKQGRIFYDTQLAKIAPNGQVRFFERFSATFQAPDFDFRQYPFDEQNFFVRLISFLPNDYYVFAELDRWSELGDQLGEEEWVSSNLTATVDIIDNRSRISFSFEGRRHVTYYILRLFVPILVIITVSWFIFFLRDYSKRIDIATSNLLLFIAFNFVISGDLPRLGYLTFLDAILAATFVVTGVIVMVNVALRRLEMSGRTALAHTIDRFVLWWYPIGYAAGVGAVALLFLA